MNHCGNIPQRIPNLFGDTGPPEGRVGQQGRGREEAQAGAAEGHHQGTILELPDNLRVQVAGRQPGIDAAPQGGIPGGQQQRRPIQ